MKSEKTTEAFRPDRRRWYQDACAAAHGLDILGERWALLVMRELMFGPKRFGELRAGLPGLSAAVLTQRLEGLEASGVLQRRMLPAPTSAQVYELTPWGYESEPILAALGRWAARAPTHDPTLPFSAASFLLSLRTMLDADLADGLRLRIGFRLADEVFAARLKKGCLTIERGEPRDADLVLAGPPAVLARAIYGERSFTRLAAEGALTVEGAPALAERFARLFPMPVRVA